MLEVKQHHHAEFGRNAGQCDEADTGGDRLLVAQQVEEPDPAGQGEGQGRHDQQGLVEAAEGQVEQHEDDQQGRRHDQQQARVGAFHVFELA